jgi:putative RecB family exonuclease
MPVYSHSKLSTFESCPQKYKFRYIDKIKVEGYDTIEAFLGSRVHEALEKLYRDVLMTRIPAVEEIVQFFDDGWERNWHPGVEVIRKEYPPDDYRNLGRSCLRSFYDRYHPFDQDKTLGLEELVTFPLLESAPGAVKSSPIYMRGVIDRLAITPGGTIEIQDYKTSRHMPTQIELDADRQLGLYQIAVNRRFPNAKEVRLVWHYLVFDQRIVSTRTPEELQALTRETLDLVDRIESETGFLPRESPLCDWCEYQSICPVFRHLFEVAELPPEKFKEEDGVKLVDTYARLKEKEEEIAAKLQETRERIIKLAKAKDLTRLIGSDQQLRISLFQDYHFPPSNDPQWQEIERLLRDAGRWEEILTVNHQKLKSIMKKETWPEELWSKVKEFAGIKDSVRLYLSKKR